MSTTCILCDNPAGSREHIFPAALGGRRVNKKIYCEKHNGELGRHVLALLDVLRFFNAKLGVRSDNHDAPRPFTIQDDDQRYQMLRDRFTLAPPAAASTLPELGVPTTLKFADRAQADRWANEQREAGFTVKFDAPDQAKVETKYFTESLHVGFAIGEAPFMRAIAYVALTYLAHYFRHYADDPGMARIKAYIRDDTVEADAVWWVDPQHAPRQGTARFDQGHSVAVSVSKERGRARAIVTFFGELSFAVDLGTLDVKSTCTRVAFVDPLAEKPGPGLDLEEVDLPTDLRVGDPGEGRDYLRALTANERPDPLITLMRRFEGAAKAAMTQALLGHIAQIRGLPEAEWPAAVGALVHSESQRVLNLLSTGIEVMITQLELPRPLLALLADAVAPDPSAPSGLSANALRSLVLAEAALSKEVLARLTADDLDQNTVMMLFAGEVGLAIVTRAVAYDVFGFSLPD